MVSLSSISRPAPMRVRQSVLVFVWVWMECVGVFSVEEEAERGGSRGQETSKMGTSWKKLANLKLALQKKIKKKKTGI